jgi:RNA polymerase sigma-70 factor (ECF subfamily)
MAYEVLNKKKKTILAGNKFFESVTENRTEKTELGLDLTEAISTLNQHYQTIIILFYHSF